MSAEVDDELWQEFHDVVNMTSRELSEWLRTEASGEVTSEDAALPELEPGEQVVAILGKRRTDLTPDDISVTVEQFYEQAAQEQQARIDIALDAHLGQIFLTRRRKEYRPAAAIVTERARCASTSVTAV